MDPFPWSVVRREGGLGTGDWGLGIGDQGAVDRDPSSAV
jgi:hypothetical protein